MKLAAGGPRGMKLSLAPVTIAAIGAIGIALMTGCGGSMQTASVPASRGPVGTTTLSSATLIPSTLAPAAWDGEESSSDHAAPAAAVPSTWGSASTTATAPATRTRTPTPAN